MTKEQVARICHETNRAYCHALGDLSQAPWEEAPEWQRTSAVNGVQFHIDNPSAGPSGSHENWLKEKLADDWKVGPVKDPAKKEHPCCVPYAELPLEQRLKDLLFTNIVHALRPVTALLLILICVGCSGISVTAGKPIPHTSIIPVRLKNSGGLDAQSINQTLLVDTNTNEIVSNTTAAGNGVTEALVTAVGNTAGSAVWGAFRRPDETSVSQHGGGSTVQQANEQQSNASASSIAITDSSPMGAGNPKNRPPANRPPSKSPKHKND